MGASEPGPEGERLILELLDEAHQDDVGAGA
jgi:hypothetical protein